MSTSVWPEGTQDNKDKHFIAATHTCFVSDFLQEIIELPGCQLCSVGPHVHMAFSAGPFSSAGLDRSHGWSCWWLELGRDWGNVVTLPCCHPLAAGSCCWLPDIQQESWLVVIVMHNRKSYKFHNVGW